MSETRPPPPKPTAENSYKIDEALVNKVLPSKLMKKQLGVFMALFGGDLEDMVPEEVVLLNIGVAAGVLEDYTLGIENDGEEGEKERKSNVEKSLEKYRWVFYTDNNLGNGLRQLLEGMIKEGIVTKVEQTDTYMITVNLS